MHQQTDVTTRTILQDRKVPFYFNFCIRLRWYLSRLGGFVILGTPRQGVKTTHSALPRSICYLYFYHDSLSEETSLVETTRALSQTPAIIPYTACLNEASNNYNYALRERIDRQMPIYENPNALTVSKDMRPYIFWANAIEFLHY